MKPAAAVLSILCCLPASRVSGECRTPKCVEDLAARAHFTVAARTPADFVGSWADVNGGDGTVLHVFPDRTYARMAFSDEFVVKVIDIGQWAVSGVTLTLQPRPQAAWTAPSEDSYIAVRTPAAKERFLVDVALLARERSTWPRRFGLRGSERRSWPDFQEQKASVIRRAWKNGYLADKTFAEVSRSRQSLAQALTTVEEADHVEALDLVKADPGVEPPLRFGVKKVVVAGDDAKRLAEFLFNCDWDARPTVGREFAPTFAITFVKAGRVARVDVCLESGEMLLKGVEGPLGGRRPLGASRETLLRIANQLRLQTVPESRR